MHPETTTTEAEARRNDDSYRALTDNRYTSQALALEVQGSLDECSELFITRLCKMPFRLHDDQRDGSFLTQWISKALQIGKVACALETMSDRDAFEEI